MVDGIVGCLIDAIDWCAQGLTSAATFSKRDPLHGDKPAELIRQGGERVQKALREMAGEKEVVDLQFLWTRRSTSCPRS